MIRIKSLEHRFVTSVPRELEPGVLYVSMEYATAVHACCCGCGEQVVTPFSPTDWRMTFDGESVSLHPSVGNWNQKCRSHYVIQRGAVIEAGPWSDRQVVAERHRDKTAKARFYGVAPEFDAAPAPAPTGQQAAPAAPRQGWWSKLAAWWLS